MIDIVTAVIRELEKEEQEYLQKLEKNKREIRRLELQKKHMGQREEKKRIHKMIVLGSTICSELRKWGGGEELYDKLMDMDDKAMVKVGLMLTDFYHKNN